jgi:hypothetical protein
LGLRSGHVRAVVGRAAPCQAPCPGRDETASLRHIIGPNPEGRQKYGGALNAQGSKVQSHAVQRIAVKAKISASEDLSAAGSGKLKVAKKSYKLKKQAKSISPGSSGNLKLKPK